MKYSPPVYNYIGSKINLLDFIQESIEDYTKKSLDNLSGIVDPFSGTGAASYMFLKNNVRSVFSNDIQYYSYVMFSHMDKTHVRTNVLVEIIDTINNTLNKTPFEPNGIQSSFVLNSYTEFGKDKRKYFTPENGRKIDWVREYIETLKIDGKITNVEFLVLLKILLQAVIKVSNVTCVYGAFLKSFKSNAMAGIQLQPEIDQFLIDTTSVHKCYNMDVFDFLDAIDTSQIEVAYLDPPYSGRRYDTSYHVLESISLYDNPVLRGKTGLRKEPSKVRFTQKTNALNDFEKMFSKLKSKYVFLSYSSDGNVSKEDMLELMARYFQNIKCYERFYKRAKTNDFKQHNKSTIKEYIFAAQTKTNCASQAPILQPSSIAPDTITNDSNETSDTSDINCIPFYGYCLDVEWALSSWFMNLKSKYE